MVLLKQNNTRAIKGARKSLKNAVLIAGCILAVSGLEASADETAAIVFKVEGPTTPTVKKGYALDTQDPIQLGDDTIMEFRHFAECQTVKIKGGLLDFDLKNYKLIGGETISKNKTDCIQKASFSSPAPTGGFTLRGASRPKKDATLPVIILTTRPSLILRGKQADTFKSLKFLKGKRLILERELNRKAFLYPSSEPCLENGQTYTLELVSKQKGKMRSLEFIATNEPMKFPFTLINTD